MAESPSSSGSLSWGSAPQRFKSGTVLIQEGACSRKMFILTLGKVRVFKTYMNQRVTLAVLGKGEVFGEFSFIDAEPRSASVEALTDIEAIVVDGDKAGNEIKSLPKWVITVFTSVTRRFRETDQKLAVLESMREYKKKNFGYDVQSGTIYRELLRFLKTLCLLYNKDKKAGGIVKVRELYQEMDDVLGQRYIGLKIFWKMLKENDFIDADKETNQGEVDLKMEPIEALEKFLLAETRSERYLMVSHAGLAILRKTVAQLKSQAESGGENVSSEVVRVPLKDLKLHVVTGHKEALQELQDAGMIDVSAESVGVKPDEISRAYVFQCVVKTFDHTIASVE